VYFFTTKKINCFYILNANMQMIKLTILFSVYVEKKKSHFILLL